MSELSHHSYQSLTHQLEREISNADFFSLANRLEIWSKLENVDCVEISSEEKILYSSASQKCNRMPFSWSFIVKIPTDKRAQIFVSLLPSSKIILGLISIFIANILLILIWVKVNRDHFRELDVRERAWLKIARQAAHDIKSPLSALKMIGELSPMNKEQKDLFVTASKKVEQIADGLLIKTKNNQTVGPLDVSEVNQIISEMIKLDEKKLKNYNIIESVETKFTGQVYANKFELERILRNLINNSIEAQGSKFLNIVVKKYSSDTFLYLTIEDNGIGIPPETLSLLAKGPVTTKASGNGLGLSNARETMHSWGGSFDIVSQPNDSTKVTLALRIYSSFAAL